MIWIILAAALVIVLVLVVFLNAQRENAILDRLHVALRTAGDDGVPPRTVNAALDRFENVLHSDETDLDARRAYSAFHHMACLLYTSPSPRDRQKSRMPSSA